MVITLHTYSDLGPLQCHHNWLLSNSKFQDGINGMCLHCIVAVRGDRKNSVPWLGRVVNIDKDKQQVKFGF